MTDSIKTGDVSADITTSAAWVALGAHQPVVAPLHLRQIFAEDPERGRELTVQAGDLYIDYSKHRVTPRDPAAARQAGCGGGCRGTPRRDAAR